MNYLLAQAFFLISFIGFSQQDSLTIATDIAADSIYYRDQKLEFSVENDSVMKMKIERGHDTMNNTLAIYSGTKSYEIHLPADPETAFPGEWKFRDPGYPMNIYANIKKGHFVTLSASGSSSNLMIGLAVYGSNGHLIQKESRGVYVVKEKRTKRKKAK
jgi:hypothetical protein